MLPIPPYQDGAGELSRQHFDAAPKAPTPDGRMECGKRPPDVWSYIRANARWGKA
jgi:hypothetical protein